MIKLEIRDRTGKARRSTDGRWCAGHVCVYCGVRTTEIPAAKLFITSYRELNAPMSVDPTNARKHQQNVKQRIYLGIKHNNPVSAYGY